MFERIEEERPRLSKEVRKCFFVETNKQHIAHNDGWRTQIASGTQHFVHQFGAGLSLRFINIQIFPLGNKNHFRRSRQFLRVTCLQFATRRYRLFDFNFFGTQKLGRFDAAYSTTFMVVPLNVTHVA